MLCSLYPVLIILCYLSQAELIACFLWQLRLSRWAQCWQTWTRPRKRKKPRSVGVYFIKILICPLENFVNCQVIIITCQQITCSCLKSLINGLVPNISHHELVYLSEVQNEIVMNKRWFTKLFWNCLYVSSMTPNNMK